MDAFQRFQGVKTRGSIRKEPVGESSALCLKILLRTRKELCNVVLEPLSPEPPCPTEIHFVCLPSQAEGDTCMLQTLPPVPAELLESLKSLHVHSLKDEEVLLLQDSRKRLEKNNRVPQVRSQTSCWSQAVCVLHRPHSPLCSVAAILALLSRYTAGFRYALELQSLQRSEPDTCPGEDDDTNQSVSSIEDEFVTALEHLEKEDTTDNLVAGPFSHRNQRDMASQTAPSARRDVPGSRVIISSHGKASLSNQAPCPEVSVSVQSSVPAWSSGPESQWSFFSPSGPRKRRVSSVRLTESDESDCSSPSPIIFLDEVGYQKSLKAKLDIPKIPILKDGVEDSDSEVSEFFDSFDRFDDLDQASESTSEPPKELTTAGQTQKNTFPEDCASKAMNPHRFDHPVLPANIKKPTPLKPGSPFGVHPDVPDSPRPVNPSSEESGNLFSPVKSSAFSPLGDGASVEYFWRTDEDSTELQKPQDLCTLYKKYSDFASNISKDILSSVCGYSSPVDMNVNKNLSCVCHKEFQNSSGHLMKLSEIQEAVTVSQSQKSQSLKEGIQKFATDLVEMSLGSAFRDLQKGVASCTTTLCHLAARLTSSVFQMAFQEIGMRRAYVLKGHAVNGLAGFLVGEAVSGALNEFHFVKKQIFNNTVARFAADLAEELVFEGIMEVCQFSHPSTPTTPSDWSFQQEEEVVSSYASDLSESVLQEAFIELSQADVAFTTEAAISLSLDNIRYVSSEDTAQTTKTCNAATSYFGLPCTANKDKALDFSENAVDTTASEGYTLTSPTKVKTRAEGCAYRLSRKTGSQGAELASKACPLPTKYSLEVPSFEPAGRGCKKIAPEEGLSSPGRTCGGTPGTPPSTPQQGPPVSQEKQIKQFSKKLKTKLSKEFSPATPPPTPRDRPVGEGSETGGEAGKADFMLKLMRSLSDEAGGTEDDQDGQEDSCGPGTAATSCPEELNVPREADHKMVERGALCYAGRLASHIVSMATEMDNLGQEAGLKFEDSDGRGGLPVHTARFSEDTLKSLWAYSGEVAGEVVEDVKRVTGVSHCRHSVSRRTVEVCHECREHMDHRDVRLTSMVDQWSSDLLTSVMSIQSSELSGTSSEYPSSESVTDEYTGYVIRVLKREGGQRELMLDQYASRLAYRSIRAGLAQAAKTTKQRPNLRLDSFRRLPHSVARQPNRSIVIETPSEDADRKECSSSKAVPCACQETRNNDRQECMELVVFAESLAYNIICDVTRKLRPSSAGLPKSLTDSCLYKKSMAEDEAKNLGKPLSCSVPHTEKSKQYHSTSTLNENNSGGVIKVIEHYARKIVDDTLELTIASSCHQPSEDKSMADRNAHTRQLSEGALCPSLADKTCCYCVIRERPFCNTVFRHRPLEMNWRRSLDCGVMSDRGCNRTRTCGIEIPKIHIDSEKRAEFAEAVVLSAIEKAKRELSNTSLNADSGIGHDGASFAESLATEIMTSAMSNVCQTINISPPGRERTHATESPGSHRLSLSTGEDSLGSWSNLSFEDDHLDETSSFLHLSDSNGNSSSWSSLGMEGEEPTSLSPAHSDGAEEKEAEPKDGVTAGQPRARGACLTALHTDLHRPSLDPQVRAGLLWIAASHSDLPILQLGQSGEEQLQQLPAVLSRVRERGWMAGDLLQALLKYCEGPEPQPDAEDPPRRKTFFQWLLEHA
ncbi:hypothetical protein COCON_G00199790 [Conger conger]|uniref:A-kinase anchor protein 11 n=1 Tax=Conger conger TaxID=82655 RepID=A0A9Q1HRC2_CONCO|nr:hypothetical protein COCON_G00199790 [Conger conger]